MKQKLLLVTALLLVLGCQLSHSQNTSGDYLIRETKGVTESSEDITIKNKTYLVQQSIGQASAIGTFFECDYTGRQDFIKPDVLAKIINIAIPLNVEAVGDPNPFVDNITISFTENMNGIETTKKALEILPNLKITAYTMFENKGYSQIMKGLGVNVSMSKSIIINELKKVILNVMTG